MKLPNIPKPLPEWAIVFLFLLFFVWTAVLMDNCHHQKASSQEGVDSVAKAVAVDTLYFDDAGLTKWEAVYITVILQTSSFEWDRISKSREGLLQIPPKGTGGLLDAAIGISGQDMPDQARKHPFLVKEIWETYQNYHNPDRDPLYALIYWQYGPTAGSDIIARYTKARILQEFDEVRQLAHFAMKIYYSVRPEEADWDDPRTWTSPENFL